MIQYLIFTLPACIWATDTVKIRRLSIMLTTHEAAGVFLTQQAPYVWYNFKQQHHRLLLLFTNVRLVT